MNLDDNPAKRHGVPAEDADAGDSLCHAAGRPGQPAGDQYGIMVLPNVFLVGRDGKVVSHTVQMSELEDEIKKLMDESNRMVERREASTEANQGELPVALRSSVSTGSRSRISPASAKPFLRSWQLSHRPHGSARRVRIVATQRLP